MLVTPDYFYDSELLFDISITKGTMFTSESVTMITDIEAPSHSSQLNYRNNASHR
jgi:hypothetical protein